MKKTYIIVNKETGEQFCPRGRNTPFVSHTASKCSWAQMRKYSYPTPWSKKVEENKPWKEQTKYEIIENNRKIDPEILRQWCVGFSEWWDEKYYDEDYYNSEKNRAFYDYYYGIINKELEL